MGGHHSKKIRELEGEIRTLEAKLADSEKQWEIAQANLEEQLSKERMAWLSIYYEFIRWAREDGYKIYQLPDLIADSYEKGLLPAAPPGTDIKGILAPPPEHDNKEYLLPPSKKCCLIKNE